MTPLQFLMVLGSTIFAALGSFLFKQGAQRLQQISLKSLTTNTRLYLGAFAFLISNVLFIIPLKQNNLSFLYAFSGLTYIWALALGAIYLEERVTSKKIIGIALIIFGIIIITL